MALRGKWSREEVAGLSRPQLLALRKNAERAKDDYVLAWCDEVLRTKPQAVGERSGGTVSKGRTEREP